MEERKPLGMSVNTYCMLLHLSQLAGMAIPLTGYILPFVLWAIRKDDYPEVDAHGKRIFNWLISLFIYILVSLSLSIFYIGIPILLLLCFVNFIFVIAGTVKANNGVSWKYPLSIEFIKVPEPSTNP